MDVDARLWRSFAAVADELHYGRAADRLRITQPALSRQIRDLERTLGVRLFDRTSRRVALSQAGQLPGKELAIHSIAVQSSCPSLAARR
jgi:DNA-binding transcriptional LysR family regulator